MKAVLIVVSLLGVFACAQEVMEAGRDIPETDRDEVQDAGLFHFDEKKCDKAKGYYSVLIVGYGHSDKDGDYGIIKTSMGTHWGEGGYMRLARNKNLCGIAGSGYYPPALSIGVAPTTLTLNK